MRRFSQARCQVQDIIEASVINAASAGLLEGELTRKIANKESQTLEHLLRIIDGFTRGKQYKLSTIRLPSPLLKPNNNFKLSNHLLSLFASPSRQSKHNRLGKVKPP